MEIEQALTHITENGLGVLATLTADGHPHTSVVFAVPIDGTLWISATQSRVKTKNVRHDPRATFISGTGPWAAVEGTVTVHDGDDVLERLRRYYRTARGEHPDWDEYDAAMVKEGRLVLELVPARAYGMMPS